MLFLNIKNKMSWVFSGYFLGIGIMLFASVMYISKFSTYFQYNEFDYEIFLYLSNIKLLPSSIVRLFKLGVATLMLSSLCFLFMLRPVNNFLKILLFIPIVIYLLINDPAVTFRIFVKLASFSDKARIQFAEKIIKAFAVGGIVLWIIYMLIPFYALIAYCRNTKIILKIHTSVISLIQLATVDILIIYFYITGPFRVVTLYNTDLLGFPAKDFRWSFYTIIQPVIIFLLITTLFITVYCRPFRNFSIITRRQARRNSQILNETISLIFHSYKNLMFAIERLSFQGAESIEKDTQIAKENLNDIHTLSKNSLDALTRNLDMLRNINYSSRTVNIKECIEAASSMVLNSSEVRFSFEVKTEDSLVKGDPYHMTECFVNLFSNSLDALKIKNTKHPFIKVTLFEEDNILCAEITDNGCGISKKNISKIFREFYSTKQSNQNWGIGLNYVKKVLTMYSGQIYVKSEENKYTRFQVVLPLYKKGGFIFGKNKSGDM